MLKKRPAGKPQDDKPASNEKGKPAAKKDDGLVIPDRNIGKPDEKPRNELDDKLINELGDGLASKDDDENPLLRAGNRMRQVEERLAQSDTSTTVRETQKKVVEDLDELLKQAEDAANQQQQQQQQKKSSKKNKRVRRTRS